MLSTYILRLFGLAWYICLFAIVIPVCMILVGTTLDQELHRLVGISIHWSTPLVLLGGLFLVMAILLGSWSSLTLYRHGKAYPWSIGHHVAYNPQSLVTCGPYSYVRHPMATSYLLVLVGISLIVPSLVMLVWLIPLAGGLFYEWFEFTEEVKLRQWFGKEYDRYHQRTPSLIPQVFHFWSKGRPIHVEPHLHHSS